MEGHGASCLTDSTVRNFPGVVQVIFYQGMPMTNKDGGNEAPTPSGVYISNQASTFARRPRRQGVEWIHIREWEAGLCGCCSSCVPNCCMATFCPCVSLAQISARLDVMPYKLTVLLYLIIQLTVWGLCGMAIYELYRAYYDASVEESDGHRYNDDVVDGDFFDAFRSAEISSNFMLYAILASTTYLLIFIFVWYLRARTRARFEIPGSSYVDCFASLCCTCCAIAQVATHIKSYKPGNCNYGPRDTLPAFAHGHIARSVSDAA